MSSFENNVNILKKLFGITNAQKVRIMEKWYYNTLMDHLWYITQPFKFLKSRPISLDPNIIDVCFLKLSEQIPSEQQRYIKQLGGFGEDMKKEYFYQYCDGIKTYTSKITGLYATNETDKILAQFFLHFLY